MQIVLILAGLIYLYPSRYFKYRDITNQAFELKRNDPRSKPVFAGEEEPEIPGWFENNATLEGIDKNQNEIRDDIDIYINRTGINDDDIRSMRQYAKELQGMLRASVDKDPIMLRKFWLGWGNAASCADIINYNLHKDREEDVLGKLIWLINKTSNKRIEADLKYSKFGETHFDTSGFSIKSGKESINYCKFKIEKPELYTK